MNVTVKEIKFMTTTGYRYKNSKYEGEYVKLPHGTVKVEFYDNLNDELNLDVTQEIDFKKLPIEIQDLAAELDKKITNHFDTLIAGYLSRKREEIKEDNND